MMFEGLRLMALGMTMVFVFLTLLVLLMHGTAAFFRVFGQYFPEPEPAAARAPGSGEPGDGARIAAAIAAIHAHRAHRR